MPSHLTELFYRHISEEVLCPICKQTEEMESHLFFGCEWAKRIWFGSALCIRPPSLFHSDNVKWLEELVLHLLGNNNRGMVQVRLLCYICWYICKGRNKFIHEHAPLDSLVTLHLSSDAANEFQLVLGGLPWQRRRDVLVLGCILGLGYHLQRELYGSIVMLHFMLLLKRGAVGLIARDWKGSAVCCRIVNLLGDVVVSVEG